MKNKGKTWSRGTNSRLPFGVNVYLNLSNIIPLTLMGSESIAHSAFGLMGY